MISEKRIKAGLQTRVKKYLREHEGITYRKAEYEVLNDLFDELPDGAYFAAMEEHGFDVEEIVKLAEEGVSEEAN